MGKKKSKINFNRIIFEFISVSFAVLFALILNQWREDRNNNHLAEKALVNIRKEFLENKKTLFDLNQNHHVALAEIDSLLTISKESYLTYDKDISLTVINSSAWEMTKITKAIYYLDFEVVNNLSKIYKLQEYYESIVKQYILKGAEAGNQNESNQKQLIDTKSFLKTIIPLEKDLVGYYDLMLEKVLTKK